MKYVDVTHYNETVRDRRKTIEDWGKEGVDYTLVFGNYGGGNKLPEWKDGDEYHGCTFVQEKAGTQIFPDEFKGSVRIVSSNVQNVRAGPCIKFEDCNEWAQADIPKWVPDDTKTQVESMVDMVGKDHALDAIGKEYAKTYFGLFDAAAGVSVP